MKKFKYVTWVTLVLLILLTLWSLFVLMLDPKVKPTYEEIIYKESTNKEYYIKITDNTDFISVLAPSILESIQIEIGKMNTDKKVVYELATSAQSCEVKVLEDHFLVLTQIKDIVQFNRYYFEDFDYTLGGEYNE